MMHEKFENLLSFLYTDASMEIISTKELAKYLKINEKKIYQLTKESKIPHIKIGGKIAYTKEIIDRWIYENTQRGNHIFIAGSDDFLLKKIIDVFNTHKKSLIFYAPVGSMNGLKALGNGVATLSCVHILDIEKNRHHIIYSNACSRKKLYSRPPVREGKQGL
jgi:excisionase family DNA binding protein